MDDVARAIRVAVAALGELDRQVVAAQDERGRRREALTREVGRLDEELRVLREDLERLGARLDAARCRGEEARSAAARARACSATVSSCAQTLVEGLRARGARGIPSLRDAVGAWEAPGLETVGAHVRRHRDQGLSNRPVRRSPEVTTHAYVYRLGSVAEVFVSEDRGVSGVAAREPGARWRAPLDPEEHARLLRTLAVLRRRIPPRWVDVALVRPPSEGP